MITAADRAFERLIDDGFRPGELEELTAEVARDLAVIGDGTLPRLSHVTCWQALDGYPSVTFHVYLTPTLVLPVALFGDAYGLDARLVAVEVLRLLPHLKAIEQVAEAELTALESCLDEVQMSSTDMRLRRAGLAPIETWNIIDHPSLTPEFDVLGDDLRRQTRAMHHSACEDLQSFYGQLVASQRRLSRLRSLFDERGATGVIDQLAASAARDLSCCDLALRAISRHERIESEEGFILRWNEGRVQSDADDREGLSWQGNLLSFRGVELPETALAAAVGKPVTLICNHAVLDEKMIVAKAWNEASRVESPEKMLRVELVPVDMLFSGPHAVIYPEPFELEAELARHEAARPTPQPRAR